MAVPESTGNPAHESIPPRGFVFAAAGVCLGLSDVWRFPYLLVEHGSIWFPLLYLAGVLLLGVPLMAAELALARLGYSRPASNFGFLAAKTGASPLWQYAGIVVLITVFLILSYSTVIGGWMMAYVVRSAMGGLDDVSVGAARLVFDSLITDPERLLGWHTLFIVALCWVASKGANAGVARFSRGLVLAIFAIAAFLVLSSLSGFGLEPLRSLDLAGGWSSLSGPLVLDAITQAFFTLGVCMGAMLILGGHLSPDARVGGLVLAVAGLDILFVGLGCAAALPVLAGGEAAGPGISFAVEAVPLALAGAAPGRVFLTLFFILLFLLVATTALVLMEFLVSWVGVKSGKSRNAAATATGVAVWTGGLLAMLSFSALSFDFEFVGEEKNFGLFDVMDVLSAQILLPVIGLLMSVFVGWNIEKSRLTDVIGWRRAVSFLHPLKRYLLPAAIVVVFVTLVFGRVLPGV